jgi:hypothetical protein
MRYLCRRRARKTLLLPLAAAATVRVRDARTGVEPPGDDAETRRSER